MLYVYDTLNCEFFLQLLEREHHYDVLMTFAMQPSGKFPISRQLFYLQIGAQASHG